MNSHASIVTVLDPEQKDDKEKCDGSRNWTIYIKYFRHKMWKTRQNIMIFIVFVVQFALKCFLNHKNPIYVDKFLPRLPKSICLVPMDYCLRAIGY